jgi:hypothetical protein
VLKQSLPYAPLNIVIVKSFPFFAIRSSLLAALAISLATAKAFGAEQQQEADNIATADNGAYIIYSTPLKGGSSANFLTQDQNHNLFFSGQAGGPKLFVLDLGKSYAIGTVRLKFKKAVPFEIYVLGGKPDNGDWTSVLSGKPTYVSDTANLLTFLKGLQGRFIVFVAASDPGPFYGLYVTGIYVPYPNNNGIFADLFNHHGNTDQDYFGSDIPEPPIRRQDYNPPVTPPSP